MTVLFNSGKSDKNELKERWNGREVWGAADVTVMIFELNFKKLD